MKVLSLFSGVGGFDLGLENAGMETVFQCEWDKHATSILQRHWPDVPRWGDITTLTGRHILDHAPVIDVVAWGSPCQDLSVAGKRAGLSGSRSGLFHEGIRIIKELRKETNNAYPRISIWENVYGALNSNKGADFGLVLDEMAEAGAMVIEWRVLDAQYFGVPQRRRRVFVVAVFDPRIATNCPDPLLPLRQGVRWNPATSRTTRKTTPGTAEESVGSSGEVAGSLTWRMKNGYNGQDAYSNLLQVVEENHARPIGEPVLGSDIVGALNAVDYKWPQNQQLGDNKFVVQPFVKAKRAQSTTDDETSVEGDINPTINQFNQGDVRASTAIVMRQREGKPGGGKGPLLSENKSLTLAAAGNDQTLFVEQPIVFENSYRDSARIAEDGVTQTLSAKMGTGGGNTPMVAIGIQGNVIGRQDHNGPAGKGHTDEGDPMFTLNTTDRHAVIQYDGYNQRIYQDDVSVTIRIGRDSSDCIAQSVVAPSLTASNDPSRSPQSAEITQQVTAIHEATMSVRRLTPLECERLMGWPDDWTAGQADTHRYKQCGNGVASPVAQWIAEQILNITQ